MIIELHVFIQTTDTRLILLLRLSVYHAHCFDNPPHISTSEQAGGRLRRMGQRKLVKNYFYEVEDA